MTTPTAPFRLESPRPTTHLRARPAFRQRRDPTSPVACAGCGAPKLRPLEARHTGTVHPPFREPRRVERGAPLCVFCYVQVESFGRTRLDEVPGK